MDLVVLPDRCTSSLPKSTSICFFSGSDSNATFLTIEKESNLGINANEEISVIPVQLNSSSASFRCMMSHSLSKSNECVLLTGLDTTMTSINLLGNSACDGSFQLLATFPLQRQQSCSQSRCYIIADTVLVNETSPGILTCRDLANPNSITRCIQFPSTHRLHQLRRIEGCPQYLIGFLVMQNQCETKRDVINNEIHWGLLDIPSIMTAMHMDYLDNYEWGSGSSTGISLVRCESLAIETIQLMGSEDACNTDNIGNDSSHCSRLLNDRDIVYHLPREMVTEDENLSAVYCFRPKLKANRFSCDAITASTNNVVSYFKDSLLVCQQHLGLIHNVEHIDVVNGPMGKTIILSSGKSIFMLQAETMTFLQEICGVGAYSITQAIHQMQTHIVVVPGRYCAQKDLLQGSDSHQYRLAYTFDDAQTLDSSSKQGNKNALLSPDYFQRPLLKVAVVFEVPGALGGIGYDFSGNFKEFGEFVNVENDVFVSKKKSSKKNKKNKQAIGDDIGCGRNIEKNEQEQLITEALQDVEETVRGKGIVGNNGSRKRPLSEIEIPNQQGAISNSKAYENYHGEKMVQLQVHDALNNQLQQTCATMKLLEKLLAEKRSALTLVSRQIVRRVELMTSTGSTTQKKTLNRTITASSKTRQQEEGCTLREVIGVKMLTNNHQPLFAIDAKIRNKVVLAPREAVIAVIDDKAAEDRSSCEDSVSNQVAPVATGALKSMVSMVNAAYFSSNGNIVFYAIVRNCSDLPVFDVSLSVESLCLRESVADSVRVTSGQAVFIDARSEACISCIIALPTICNKFTSSSRSGRNAVNLGVTVTWSNIDIDRNGTIANDDLPSILKSNMYRTSYEVRQGYIPSRQISRHGCKLSIDLSEDPSSRSLDRRTMAILQRIKSNSNAGAYQCNSLFSSADYQGFSLFEVLCYWAETRLGRLNIYSYFHFMPVRFMQLPTGLCTNNGDEEPDVDNEESPSSLSNFMRLMPSYPSNGIKEFLLVHPSSYSSSSSPSHVDVNVRVDDDTSLFGGGYQIFAVIKELLRLDDKITMGERRIVTSSLATPSTVAAVLSSELESGSNPIASIATVATCIVITQPCQGLQCRPGHDCLVTMQLEEFRRLSYDLPSSSIKCIPIINSRFLLDVGAHVKLVLQYMMDELKALAVVYKHNIKRIPPGYLLQQQQHQQQRVRLGKTLAARSDITIQLCERQARVDEAMSIMEFIFSIIAIS